MNTIKVTGYTGANNEFVLYYLLDLVMVAASLSCSCRDGMIIDLPQNYNF